MGNQHDESMLVIFIMIHHLHRPGKHKSSTPFCRGIDPKVFSWWNQGLLRVFRKCIFGKNYSSGLEIAKHAAIYRYILSNFLDHDVNKILALFLG